MVLGGAPAFQECKSSRLSPLGVFKPFGTAETDLKIPRVALQVNRFAAEDGFEPRDGAQACFLLNDPKKLGD